MEDVLLSGKSSFKIEVPYKLIETAPQAEKKPLIVYLHGYRENIILFEKRVQPLLELSAYHLFIQGPYPIYDESRKRKVPNWGRAWYLYDGEQQQFIRSLELSSEFIQEIIDNVIPHISVSRICLIGYSMGGYQAGYFALSRWKHVNELVVVGGRIKTEVFRERPRSYQHLQVLALHGTRDKKVALEPQEDSVNELAEWGASVTFKEVDAAHKLTKKYLTEITKWLYSCGYESVGQKK